MGLRDVPLKSSYDSGTDDVLREFYIPALSQSVEYDRIAGFFSSTALAVAAKGVAPFLRNGGRMRLVCSPRLRRNDVEAIQRGTKARDETLAASMIASLERIEDQLMRDHVEALAWMIAHVQLDIKVSVVADEDGVPLTHAEAAERGIFHQKVGILRDKEGNELSFSGSINESAAGWVNNIEEFKVFVNWNPGLKEFLASDRAKFERYWNDESDHARTYDIPGAVRDKLIEFSPDDLDKLNLDALERNRHGLQLTINLWKHQRDAIEAWKKSNYRGIWAMATGAGKTLAALAASQLDHIPITLISVPTSPLLNQWVDEIRKFDPSAEVIACSGDNLFWKRVLPARLAPMRNSRRGERASSGRLRTYIVAIINTMSSEEFLSTFEGIDSTCVQLVGDEVHHLGAPKFQRCLELPASRRLGLSATPERQWDPVGTDAVNSFFGGTIYEYGVKEAIRDGILSHYRYYPRFAYLSRVEFEGFQECTKEIDRIFPKIGGQIRDPEVKSSLEKKLERLLRERALIKKKAQDKVRVFDEILQEDLPSPLLVFCEDTEQLDQLAAVLDDSRKSHLRYTSEESKFQRQETVKTFEEGDIDILLAIRCLDEGIDVPKCPGCIVVASSSSSREFVQRRGRILRIGSSEKIASLYDIVVLPLEMRAYDDPRAAEKLVERELDRVWQLVDAADNKWNVVNNIREQLDQYGLGHLALLSRDTDGN